MAFAAVLAAAPHSHAAQTDLIPPRSPSEALSRCLHLPRRSVQSGFTRRLRDGKNHIYYDTIHPNYDKLRMTRRTPDGGLVPFRIADHGLFTPRLTHKLSTPRHPGTGWALRCGRGTVIFQWRFLQILHIDITTSYILLLLRDDAYKSFEKGLCPREFTGQWLQRERPDACQGCLPFSTRKLLSLGRHGNATFI